MSSIIKLKSIIKENKVFTDKSPEEIISMVLSEAKRPIITTNFGPFSASLLHAVISQSPKITVIWIDTGYNTPETYKFALNLIGLLKLNIEIFVPMQSVAYREHTLGIPSSEDPKHTIFTDQVKLEPFRRAMKIHNPDLWFTNIRRDQTSHRKNLNILSYSKDDVLKISPFYNYSDKDLKIYLEKHQLPNETRYYDPTKQFDNRECGLHY